MDIFRVKYDEKIVIHQRYMLFRFEVAQAEPGKVHLDFYLPCFEEGGRPGCMDNLQRDTLEIGEPLLFEQEGSVEMSIEEGTVEITVASVEGDDVTVYVKVPDGWGAIKENDISDVDDEWESDA